MKFFAGVLLPNLLLALLFNAQVCFAIFGLPGSSIPITSFSVSKIVENLRRKETPLDKFIYLREVATTNADLYYAALVNNIEELMPVVYTPTVGAACQNHSIITTPSMKPTAATGLYVTLDDLGNVPSVLEKVRREAVGNLQES